MPASAPGRARADGARWIALAAVGLALAVALEVGFGRWVSHRLDTWQFGAELDTWLLRWRLVNTTTSMFGFVALAALASGLGRLGDRGAARAGRVALAIAVLSGLAGQVLASVWPEPACRTLHGGLLLAHSVAEFAGLVLAAAALGRITAARMPWTRWLPAAAIAVLGAGNLALLTHNLRALASATSWWAVQVAAFVVAVTGLAGLAAYAANLLRADDGGADDRRADWRLARSGLERFASASVARVVIALLFVPLSLLLGLGGGVKTVAVLMLIAAGISVLLSAEALAGLARYQRVPGTGPARRLVSTAVVLGALALALEATLALEALRLSFSHAVDFLPARVPTMPAGVDTALRLSALASWLALVASFGRLARQLAAPEVEGRTTALLVGLALLFGLAAAGSYGLATHPEAIRTPVLGIAAMMAVAGLALWGTLVLARTARALAAAIDRLGDGEPPAAATLIQRPEPR